MEFISYVLFGLVVGIVAKLLMPGRDPGGFIVTILIGIAGSLVGTFVGRMLFGVDYSAGWIGAIIGAIFLLWLYRLATRRRSARV